MLRIVKILLMLSVAAWGFVGGLFNLLDWNAGTLGSVATATSMSAIEGGADSWQATSNPVIVWLGAIFIAGSKFVAGALCVMGAFRMWGARTADAGNFDAAKELALAGCGVAMLMLFAGFVVVGESWFELWRHEGLRSASLQSAFRYGGMIMLIALFVGMRER